MDKVKKKPNYLVLIIAILALGTAAYLFFFKDRDSAGDEPVLLNYVIEDPFVTNVKNSSKLFKTTVVLVVNEEKISEFLDTNLYIIRDEILFIIRDLAEEDITKQGIEEELRVSMPKALNEALQIDSIISVLFSDFVMQ